MFYPNVPGATFIQGATLIPESRVGTVHKILMNLNCSGTGNTKMDFVCLLQVGDEILSVNGNLFGHLTHDEAVSVLKSSHRLCFLVRYIGKVPHSSLLPKNQRAANPQTHHESQGNLI